MRHGIRPPTSAIVTPEGIAADPWPAWSTPYGELTEHGYRAIRLLGVYDRLSWSQAGLLPAAGCPAKGNVAVVADNEERTLATGDALVEGLFPGCHIVNARLSEAEAKSLFSPLDAPGSLDGAAAKAAIEAKVGDISAVQSAHRAAFDRLQAVLVCCSPPACAAAALAAPCRIADMPSAVAVKDQAPHLTGPLGFGPTAAQVLMLEYVEGMPMRQVGWGRASQADIEAIMTIHSLKGEILQRPPYLGARGAANLARRMLQAVEASGPAGANGAKLTVLVGHDTNIVDLSGLLGFDWRVPSYPANNASPGGGVGFEVLRGAAGQRYVRGFYRSQTMDQMRGLTALDLKTPPFQQYLSIAGCSLGADRTICTLAQFDRLVRSKLPPTAKAP